MSNIESKVDDHEKRLTKIEIDSARLDERLDALVSSTNNLKWSMFAFSFIMLLTIIWGAIGERGFNQVVKTPVPQVQNSK